MVKGNKPLIRQDTLQIYYFPLIKSVIEEHGSTMIKEENKLSLKLMTDTHTHTHTHTNKHTYTHIHTHTHAHTHTHRQTDRKAQNNMPPIFDSGGIKRKTSRKAIWVYSVI